MTFASVPSPFERFREKSTHITDFFHTSLATVPVVNHITNLTSSSTGTGGGGRAALLIFFDAALASPDAFFAFFPMVKVVFVLVF